VSSARGSRFAQGREPSRDAAGHSLPSDQSMQYVESSERRAAHATAQGEALRHGPQTPTSPSPSRLQVNHPTTPEQHDPARPTRTPASPCFMLPDEVVVTALVGLLTSAVTAIGLAALGARLTDGLGPAIGMTQVCTARALLAAAYGRSRLHLLGGRQGQPDELKPTGSTRSRHRLADPAVHGTWSPARHLVARTA